MRLVRLLIDRGSYQLADSSAAALLADVESAGSLDSLGLADILDIASEESGTISTQT